MTEMGLQIYLYAGIQWGPDTDGPSVLLCTMRHPWVLGRGQHDLF